MFFGHSWIHSWIPSALQTTRNPKWRMGPAHPVQVLSVRHLTLAMLRHPKAFRHASGDWRDSVLALLIYWSLYCFAMASKDTPGEEFNSLKDACKSDNAKVHGLVSSLSPMKKGKSAHFLEGKICDQDKEM